MTVYTKSHYDGKFNPAKSRNNHLASLGGVFILKIEDLRLKIIGHTASWLKAIEN